VAAQAWYLQAKLAHKRTALAFHHLWRDFVKVLIASAGMGLVVAAGWWGWSRAITPTKLSDASALVVLIGAGMAIYAGLLWALKIDGRDDLLALLKRKKIAA
jgi:putative peptidoglycan lipid II flippase